ncbi:macrolide transport system ATP-binding/permease protein [Actinoplanes octamycinicus]|uniref:Macrolide transport system ATP-binding/permease protein n=1 Tax=Actinoplanes octamycinicus TaxID=135948 RepID=A0A7W7M6E3_9ACTN|nr:ATP-binding cassette domain-containing protein [Actinoplanes octamycinicus]MBB4738693.1 macrolide transport system ATP-binding/permease protein [Actinoplanes octamycinicus]GIE61426.1 hypothetical protein Aoc01nite_68280 [Actinoplanes octamycinicus]
MPVTITLPARARAQLVATGIRADRAGLSNLALTVSPGSRWGIVGENGRGKTTLLRVLSGTLPPDAGEVRLTGTLGVADQELSFAPGETVGTLIEAALADARAALFALDEAAQALAGAYSDPGHDHVGSFTRDRSGAGDGDAGSFTRDRSGADGGYAGSLAGDRSSATDGYAGPFAGGLSGAGDDYARALDAVELLDAWDADRRIDLALEQLGAVTDRDRLLATLSVGQRYRVRLACLLGATHDFLLLDEPTNHLDADGLDFLTARLRSHPGGVVLVSHDRALLRDVTTTILDLDPTVDGRPAVYGGGYPGYQAGRAAALARWEQTYEQQTATAKRLAEELTGAQDRLVTGWRPDKGTGRHKRATRAPGLVRSVHRRQDELLRHAVTAPQPPGRFRMPSLPAIPGRALLTADRLQLTGRLRTPVTLTLNSGSRLLITGPNGTGKSTLLSLLAGLLTPTAGAATHPTDIRIALLTQESPSDTPSEKSRSAMLSEDSRLATSATDSRLVTSAEGSWLAASATDSRLVTSAEGSWLAASAEDSRLVTSAEGSWLAASAEGSRLAASSEDSRVVTSAEDSRLVMSSEKSQSVSSSEASGPITSSEVNATGHRSAGNSHRASANRSGDPTSLAPIELGLLTASDLDRPAHRLSMGQRRRLDLASLLAAEPHVLLLDEPTNHLSITLVDELTEALLHTPAAVVVATHDRQLLKDLSSWPQLNLA